MKRNLFISLVACVFCLNACDDNDGTGGSCDASYVDVCVNGGTARTCVGEKITEIKCTGDERCDLGKCQVLEPCTRDQQDKTKFGCREGAEFEESAKYACTGDKKYGYYWRMLKSDPCPLHGCAADTGLCIFLAEWEGQECDALSRDVCRDGFVATCGDHGLVGMDCDPGEKCMEVEGLDNVVCKRPCTAEEVGAEIRACKQNTAHKQLCVQGKDKSDHVIYTYESLDDGEECEEGCKNGKCFYDHPAVGKACSEEGLASGETKCDENYFLICNDEGTIEVDKCGACVEEGTGNNAEVYCYEPCKEEEEGFVRHISCTEDAARGFEEDRKSCKKVNDQLVWVESKFQCEEGCNEQGTACSVLKPIEVCNKELFIERCEGTNIVKCEQGRFVYEDCTNITSNYSGETVSGSYENTCVQTRSGASCQPACNAESDKAVLVCETDGDNARLHGDECVPDLNEHYYWSSHSEKCAHGCDEESGNKNCLRLIPEEGMRCEENTFEETCIGNYRLSCVDGYTVAEECSGDNSVCGINNGHALCAAACEESDVGPLVLECDTTSHGRQCVEQNGKYFWLEFNEECFHGCESDGRCIHVDEAEGTECDMASVPYCSNNKLFKCVHSKVSVTNCAETQTSCVSDGFRSQCIDVCSEDEYNNSVQKTVCSTAVDEEVLVCSDSGTYLTEHVWASNGEVSHCQGECDKSAGKCKEYADLGNPCSTNSNSENFFPDRCDGNVRLYCHNGTVDVENCLDDNGSVCIGAPGAARCVMSCDPTTYQPRVECKVKNANTLQEAHIETTYTCVLKEGKYVVNGDDVTCLEPCDTNANRCGAPRYTEGEDCVSYSFLERCSDTQRIFKCKDGVVVAEECGERRVCRNKQTLNWTSAASFCY